MAVSEAKATERSSPTNEAGLQVVDAEVYVRPPTVRDLMEQALKDALIGRQFIPHGKRKPRAITDVSLYSTDHDGYSGWGLNVSLDDGTSADDFDLEYCEALSG